MSSASESGGARRTRRQRGSISAEEIVKGAFEVTRGISLDKLSMPNLAEHLDVGVTSIYWYFRKKEELLNAMTDVAVDSYVRAMPQVTPDKTWQQALREHYAAQRQIFGSDDTWSDLLLIRTSTYGRDATRRVLELVEKVVGLLVEQGFTPGNAIRVNNTISVYTRGMVIRDRILRLSDGAQKSDASDGRTLGDRQRQVTDWSTMPILASLLDKYSLSGTRDDDFAFGVDRLISGFERLLEEQDAKPAKAAKTAKRPAAKPAPARRPGRTRKAAVGG